MAKEAQKQTAPVVVPQQSSLSPTRAGRPLAFAQFREQVQFIGSKLGLRGSINLTNNDDRKTVSRMELHPAGVYYVLANGEDGVIPSANVVNVRFAPDVAEA